MTKNEILDHIAQCMEDFREYGWWDHFYEDGELDDWHSLLDKVTLLLDESIKAVKQLKETE